MSAISLMLHDVVESPPAMVAPYTISRDQLRGHLDAIHDRAGSEAVRCSDHGEPANPRSVYLTFDDGYASAHHCVSEELARFRWPGHFFIVTDWIGRNGYLDRDAIRDLVRCGHVVGSHSCSHPEWMADLPFESLLREWEESREILQEILGTPVQKASVPAGYYSREVAKAAARAGIKVLFTSEPIATHKSIEGCLVLGRYSIQRSTSSATVGAIAAGEALPRIQQAAMWSLKKIVKHAAGESYLAIRRSLLERGLGS